VVLTSVLWLVGIGTVAEFDAAAMVQGVSRLLSLNLRNVAVVSSSPHASKTLVVVCSVTTTTLLAPIHASVLNDGKQLQIVLVQSGLPVTSVIVAIPAVVPTPAPTSISFGDGVRTYSSPASRTPVYVWVSAIAVAIVLLLAL